MIDSRLLLMMALAPLEMNKINSVLPTARTPNKPQPKPHQGAKEMARRKKKLNEVK